MAKQYCMTEQTLWLLGVIGELTEAHNNDEFEVGFGPCGAGILQAKSNAMFTLTVSYTWYGKVTTDHLIVTADFKENPDSLREGKIRNIRGIYRLTSTDLDWIIKHNTWPKTNIDHATTVQGVLDWYKKLQ